MKTKALILMLLTFMITVSAMSQKDPVDRIFDKYSGKEGFTTVYISSKMFSLFAEIDPDDQELQDMMNGLKSIRILASDDDEESGGGGINFYKEVMKDLAVEKYEELMVIKDGNQDLKFLIREEDGKIVELLLVGGGDGDNVLISIRGIIDMKNIGKIGKALNVEGLENIEKIDKK